MTNLTYHPSENRLTCIFSGRLDTIVSGTLQEDIRKALLDLPRGADGLITYSIVFDLKEVNYIASSFIRICVNTAKQAVQGAFSVVNCDPFIRNTFKIAGLDELLSVS